MNAKMKTMSLGTVSGLVPFKWEVALHGAMPESKTNPIPDDVVREWQAARTSFDAFCKEVSQTLDSTVLQKTMKATVRSREVTTTVKIKSSNVRYNMGGAWINLRGSARKDEQ